MTERRENTNGRNGHREHGLGPAEHLALLLVNLARATNGSPDVAEVLERGRAAARTEDPAAWRQAELELRAYCYRHDLPHVLALSGLPFVYNIRRRFEENVDGPWDKFPDIDPSLRERRWPLLGFDIAYPIGIPASVLTSTARFVTYYSRYGFNVFTLQSVRSRKHSALQFPNWVYLQDATEPLPVSDSPPDAVIGEPDTFFTDPRAYSMANSFGVPSDEPVNWQAELSQILESLDDERLLIQSVLGTWDEGDTFSDLADDFVRVALQAAETGVHAIELNLSCPNTPDRNSEGDVEPPLCFDTTSTRQVVEEVKNAIASHNVKLVAKLSYLPKAPLEDLLGEIAPFVDGVAGINTLQCTVRDTAGRPTFPGRKRAGVSGIAIREYALDFVRNAASLRDANGWSFDLLGMGGVMEAHDARKLMRAGANAVQTATAALQNPTLALEVARPDSDDLGESAFRVLEIIEQEPLVDDVGIAAGSRLALPVVRAALHDLQKRRYIKRAGTSATGRPTFELDEVGLQKIVS